MNPPDPTSTASAAGIEPGHPISVLLVDDQLMVAEALRRMLAHETDITFHYCADPRKAVTTAGALAASVILQDLVMPDLDGMTLVQQYRADPATREIPIIVLSSTEDAPTKRDAFVRGANDYLVKLPDPIELAARIRAHARSYFAQQRLRETQLRLEESNALLERLAVHDPLTGLGNRRCLDDLLQREWRRCAREAIPLAVVMIDIDSFKAFNDRYGHPGGDECLRRVAACLQRSLQRPADFVARYGGEEFAVVLPNTDLAGALQVAERLRAAVSAARLEHQASPCADHVTLSLGAAARIPTLDGHPDTIVTAADQALYSAKRGGRNRVVGADTPPANPLAVAA